MKESSERPAESRDDTHRDGAPHRVHATRVGAAELRLAIRNALDGAGLLERLGAGTRVALKPNLTYPYHRPGVTTSPQFLEATLSILREHTSKIVIVETDGGYGAWAAEEAFRGHGLLEMGERYGVEVINLCREESRPIKVMVIGGTRLVPLPIRLLEHTDLLISMPVPKVHCMTRVTLAFKNQWGCIPEAMRLRRHSFFERAIVAIDAALRPAVLSDGVHFLDHNGPMEGVPVKMDLVIAASTAGAFDRYVSELMQVHWRSVAHLRTAARAGRMPERLEQISYNIAPSALSSRKFHLRRTMRNWIALAGFKSRFLTWLGYESWFGRRVLHEILYAVAGKKVRPSPLATVHSTSSDSDL